MPYPSVGLERYRDYTIAWQIHNDSVEGVVNGPNGYRYKFQGDDVNDIKITGRELVDAHIKKNKKMSAAEEMDEKILKRLADKKQ